MMFQKKVDRAMNWLKEKKISEISSEIDNFDQKAELETQDNDKIKFEKIDIIAIIISALMVFGPIFIILIIILILVFPG